MKTRNAGLFAGPDTSPIVVLTAARSGSTLLRLLLDKHPDIACPPETNIVKTCTKLGAAWKTINNSDELSVPAVQVIRTAAGGIFADYLARRGKKRFCDKSLGTVEDAGEFLQIFPETKFICLYRHCMDVIFSAIEACPWGVAGYGFDPYVNVCPGNDVAALAHYWADYTAGIADFEAEHPDICRRVRYESLVTKTGPVCQDLARFLGLPSAAWHWQDALRTSEEMSGAADYKVWSTGAVTNESVGRGVAVPVRVIPPPVLAAVNEQLGRLDYPPIDLSWNQLSRSDVLGQWQPAEDQEAEESRELEEAAELISQRIAAGLTGLSANSGRWKNLDGNKYVVVSAYSGKESRRKVEWLIDLEKFESSRGTGYPGQGTEVAWFMTGEAAEFKAVLSGQVDLAVALRKGNLRILNQLHAHGDDEGVRISLAANILALAR
jgi:protein-tyrosine sulfotransferase